MAVSPMFPLWTDAYLGDTHHLTTLEHGAYLLLLITAWRSKDGLLPDDDKVLSRYAKLTTDKWIKIKPVIESFFEVKDGFWAQGRLLDERKADFDFRKSQSKKGKARHLKNKDFDQPRLNSADVRLQPPPTPTPIEDTIVSSPPIVPQTETQKSVKTKLEKPDDIPENLWKDFLELRKAKNAPVTETALKGINREASKAGWTLQQALTECCARGWIGFKAEWIERDKPARNGNGAKPTYSDNLLKARNLAMAAIDNRSDSDEINF